MTPTQRQYRGLLIGSGTPFVVRTEEGLEGFQIRDGDLPIPRDDGSIPGLHTVESKQVTLEIAVKQPTVNLPSLLEAFTPSRTIQHQYRFVDAAGVESFVWARPSVVRVRREPGSQFVQETMVVLKVADPRIYSTELFSTLVPVFGASGGGFDWTVEWPLDMTAAEQELGVAVNSGFREAFPRVVFQHESGTVSGVLLENLTSGDELNIVTTVTAGQQLVADMDALVRATGAPVVSIDGASRYGDWQPPRDPFRLLRGSNTLRFTVSGGGSAVCSVSWRSTS